MKKKAAFRATSLRSLLIFILVIVIGLASAGFSFAFNWLQSYAVQVNQTVQAAHTTSIPSTATSPALQNALSQESALTAKLALFYASPATAQAKAIADLKSYAQKSGLAIHDVSAAGSDPTTLVVSLNAPVSYNSLLKFITYVQNSLPKLQIQQLTLKHSASDTASTVTIDSIDVKAVTQ